MSTKQSSVDPREVAKFAASAAKWWHPDGSAAPLHRMNPTRVAYIRAVIERNIINQRSIETTPPSSKPLTGIDLVDVGCGGGLVTEPFARLGANVLGIDKSKESLAVAQHHAARDPYLESSGRLHYKEAAVEDLTAAEASFDVVLALEIIEHVSEPTAFLRDCASLVREGGILVISTLNRTLMSYALGIIAAERILGWLEPGTHDWTKFPRPEEVAHIIETETKLLPDEVVGVGYRPLSGRFAIVNDTAMNYILTAGRPRLHKTATDATSGTA